MERIICDTNIWYYLGQDIRLRELTAHLKLIPTFPALFEIGTSSKILKDINLSQSAIRAMMQFSKDLVLINPINYLISLDDVTIPIEPNYGPLLQFTQRLANGLVLNRTEKEKFKDFSNLAREPHQLIANYFNEFNDRLPKRTNKRMRIAEAMTIDEAWNFLDEIVIRTTESLYNLKQVERTRCSLFLNLFNDKFKRLTEIKGSKFDANDYLDLMNLVYVGPGDVYWTAEEKAINKRIKALNLHEYIFKNEDILNRLEIVKASIRNRPH